MDTQAMLPVLAMMAELIAMLGFRWVSVPDLRYSPYAQAGILWKLEETAKFIQSRSLCGLGKSAPLPVLSTIREFRDEYEEHIRDK